MRTDHLLQILNFVFLATESLLLPQSRNPYLHRCYLFLEHENESALAFECAYLET
jgi:hypothetical protein